MSYVWKVISGGQIGADLAGLKAAKALGLETGGWCPKGWRQQPGPCPELGTVYGLREHSSSKYPPRTYLNVRESDATIRLATNFSSPGERCTMRAIEYHRKRFFDVPFTRENDTFVTSVNPAEVRDWLFRHRVGVLNVAGNALPGLEQPVFEFLCEVFT